MEGESLEDGDGEQDGGRKKLEGDRKSNGDMMDVGREGRDVSGRKEGM